MIRAATAGGGGGGDLIVVLIIVVIFCYLVGAVSSLIKSDTPHLQETAQPQTPSSTLPAPLYRELNGKWAYPSDNDGAQCSECCN